MRSVLIVVLGLLILIEPAHSQRVSNLNGGKLGNICLSKERSQIEACRAYLDGISDSIGFYQALVPSDGTKGSKLPEYVCIPKEKTGAQLQDAFLTWLRSHKDAERYIAATAVLRAFNDTYPCAGESPK